MELFVSDQPSSDAGQWIAAKLGNAIRRRQCASIAVSGGSTAPAMLDALLDQDVPWNLVTFWQVDERIAPDAHADRNANQLVSIPSRVRLMPVTVSDLRAGARRYAASLPDRFDVVHLGLGADGHTASWPPGDDVESSKRDVELTEVFHGRPRMTLTSGVVNRARSRVVLATGSAKSGTVARWFSRDPALPICHVRSTGTTVILDPAASADLSL